jgi:lysophospholipase L1-like esterase
MTGTSVQKAAPGRAWRRTALKLLFSVGLTLALVEVGCRVVLRMQLAGLRAMMGVPAFYYEPSADPVLVYELKRGYTFTHDGRRVHVNGEGIRDDEETVPAAPRRVAILGDSVVFGTFQDQAATLGAGLQRRLDPGGASIRVLNFGVPGYAVREVARFFQDKDAIYHLTDAVYLLNPNDFAWRDTRFEGADGGLYRMFRAPSSAALLFLQKAEYRVHRSGSLFHDALVSVPWYEWMFAGTRARAYESIREAKAYAAAHGIRLAVVPLPAGCAYRGATYALDAMYDDIGGFLRAEGIPTRDVRAEMASPSYFDLSDHLTPPGNERMAEALAKVIATQEATKEAPGTPP